MCERFQFGYKYNHYDMAARTNFRIRGDKMRTNGKGLQILIQFFVLIHKKVHTCTIKAPGIPGAQKISQRLYTTPDQR